MATEVPVCSRADALNCEGGVCVPLVGLGEGCTTNNSCAGEERYCQGSCKARLPAGGSCSAGNDACDSLSECDFMTLKCIPRLANGEPCDSNTSCLSGYCDGVSCGTSPGFGGVTLLLLCQ